MAVGWIKPKLIHLKQCQGFFGRWLINNTITVHVGVVTHALQEAVGNAGREARPGRQ